MHNPDTSKTKSHSPNDLKECPIFITLSLIANKWSIRILENLLNAGNHTLRFSRLKQALGGISQRELTRHLREFEKSGIVSRMVYAEMPLRVEYTLTPLGKTLCEPIHALSGWAEKYGATVCKSREQYEKQA